VVEEDPDSTVQRPRKAVRTKTGPLVQVRRLHRRDLNKVWDFLKRSFRDVNLETVEYQRPRSKKRFYETYEEEGVEQLLFVVDGDIVAYTECTYEIIGSDTWINPRYFEKRDMRPLFVEELAVHPDWAGRGVGSFVLEQIQHLAKVRGLTHLVLEVAENNTHAMTWYRKRGFRKLDASVFMAYAVDVAPELLPPRALETEQEAGADGKAILVVPVSEDGADASNGARSGPATGDAEAARPKPGGKAKTARVSKKAARAARTKTSAAKAKGKRAGGTNARAAKASRPPVASDAPEASGVTAASPAPATIETPPATIETPPATIETPPATIETPPATIGTPPAPAAASGKPGNPVAREGAAPAGDRGESDIAAGPDGKNGQHRAAQRRETAPAGPAPVTAPGRRRPS